MNSHHKLRLLAVVGLVVVAAAATADVNVMPKPKQLQVGEGEIVFEQPVTVVVKDDCLGRDRTAPRQLADRIKALTGTRPLKAAAPGFAGDRPALIIGEAGHNAAVDRIRIQYPSRVEPPAHEPEGFAISTGPYGVLVQGGGPAGTFYGTQTLMQCLSSSKGQLICPQVTIVDQPDFPLRIAMMGIWGPSSGTITNMDFAFAKQLIRDLISCNRYNAVLISAKFQFESHPEAGHLYPDIKSELRELINYCRLHFVETIPIHDPRHLVQNIPELAENKEHAATSNMCYRHPRALPLLFEVWAEIIELFQPKYFHICMDEITLYPGQQWGVCERCKGTAAPELMAEALTNISNWLTAQGVQPCMWGDQFLNPEQFAGLPSCFGATTWQTLDLTPKDVIIFDWHYGAEQDYPSIDYFLLKGFRVVGCPSTYNSANWENFSRYCRARRDNPLMLGMHQTAWVMTMRRKDYDRPEPPKLGFYDDEAVRAGVREAGRVFWRAPQ